MGVVSFATSEYTVEHGMEAMELGVRATIADSVLLRVEGLGLDLAVDLAPGSAVELGEQLIAAACEITED